jgi:hypothetical protein
MIYLTLLAFLALLSIPILIAIAESQRQSINSNDEGYWTLSRALMGGCHIKWSPDPLPIVWFDVGLSQGRLHIARRAGDLGWWFEGRLYLSSSLGFAARLHSPEELPLQPSLPSFIEIEDEEEDSELKLSGFSIESNAPPRLMQCLAEDDVRKLIKSLKGSLKINTCEIFFAHRVFVVRGRLENENKASDIAEKIGPHLANWLRQIVVPLNQSSDRLISRDDYNQCPVSAVDLTSGFDIGEVWQCSSCDLKMYRTAMEIMKGCVNPHCEQTIDGVSEEVILSGRPHLEIIEVDKSEIGDLGWVDGIQ